MKKFNKNKFKKFLFDDNKLFCFDVDEIFLEHIKSVLPYINQDQKCIEILKRKDSYPLKFEDLTHFSYIYELLGEHSQKYFVQEKSYENIEFVPYSLQMFKFLNTFFPKDRIRFITASHPDTEKIKEKILIENLKVDIGQIIHTHQKKDFYMENIFIDDSISHFNEIIDNEDSFGIILSKPWNISFSHQNLNRVDDLKELNNIIKESLNLSKKRQPVKVSV